MTARRDMHSPIKIEGPGVDLSVVHRPRGEPDSYRLRNVIPIEYVAFDRCPICLEPNPTSREHVPQGAIGGRVMTKTCPSCNNDLGSRVEDELTDWYFDAVGRVRLANEDVVPGRRKIPRVLIRSTTADEFVLLVMGAIDDGVRQMLIAGQFEAEFAPPDPERYRIAALKHAYLAACLHLRTIPLGSTADEIRHELLQARDASRSGPVPPSTHADLLQLSRSFDAAPDLPPLALVTLVDQEDNELERIVLAGTLALSWPFADIPLSAKPSGSDA